MKLTDFFSRVESDATLLGLGFDQEDPAHPAFIVQHRTNHLGTRLPVEAIESADWDILYDILIGRREPLALQHMTRVVGYYSRVENWNKSKVGELKDRHRGRYGVADADAGTVAPQHSVPEAVSA